MADPPPALTQVIAAIATQLAQPGTNVFTDRDSAEPVAEDERPARVVRCTDVQLDERMETGFTAQLHIATIDVDHYADSDAVDNLNSLLATMVSDSVALIGADDTLGAKVFELTMVSATANADDVPDAGVAILTFQVKFQTHLYDWTHLVPNH